MVAGNAEPRLQLDLEGRPIVARRILDHLDQGEADPIGRADAIAQGSIGAEDQGRAIGVRQTLDDDEGIDDGAPAADAFQNEAAEFIGKRDAAQRETAATGRAGPQQGGNRQAQEKIAAARRAAAGAMARPYVESRQIQRRTRAL